MQHFSEYVDDKNMDAPNPKEGEGIPPVGSVEKAGLDKPHATKQHASHEHAGSAHARHASNTPTNTQHVRHDNPNNMPHDIYKPTEHGGLKKDGTPDERVKNVDANAAPQQQTARSHPQARTTNRQDSAQLDSANDAEYKPTEEDKRIEEADKRDMQHFNDFVDDKKMDVPDPHLGENIKPVGSVEKADKEQLKQVLNSK